MSENLFKAMIVSEIENFKFVREIKSRNIDELPEGDLLVNVKYSSLNYKDALSASGNKGVTRSYPHTPGIDAAGIVVESRNEKFKLGDKVIVMDYDLGMNTPGGFGQYIHVPSEWVLKLPENLTLKQSMIYGTAGITAALSVYRLLNSGVKPDNGEILVTGATGGVGNIALSILSKIGYNVIAATGKSEEKDKLLRFGAKEVISREEIDDQSGKALLKGRWAGVIDTVGGNILSTAIKSTKYGGGITCCGNVSSHEFTSSIYPFILRGVTLLGIDAAECKMVLRENLWSLLANDWRIDSLEDCYDEVSLEGLSEKIDLMLAGKHKGRTIVNLEL